MKNKIKSFLRFAFIAIAIALSLSLLGGISKIGSSTQKITDAENKVDELKRENEELKRELHIAQSTQFIEQIARDKLGLARRGEIVVVLPDADALRSLAPKLPEEKFSLPDPNWKLWLRLFF